MQNKERTSPGPAAEGPRSHNLWDFKPTARPYTDLYPPECFCERRVSPKKQEGIRPGCGPDTMREKSLAIGMHQASTCAGWAERPTPAEFYEAIRAEEPTERQVNMLSQWVEEARWETIFHAWVEEVYTWRQLATALHRAGLHHSRWSRTLNGWAEQPPGTASVAAPGPRRRAPDLGERPAPSQNDNDHGRQRVG